jgi:hypothetical protein
MTSFHRTGTQDYLGRLRSSRCAQLWPPSVHWPAVSTTVASSVRSGAGYGNLESPQLRSPPPPAPRSGTFYCRRPVVMGLTAYSLAAKGPLCPEHLGLGHYHDLAQSEFGNRRKARLEPDARCTSHRTTRFARNVERESSRRSATATKVALFQGKDGDEEAALPARRAGRRHGDVHDWRFCCQKRPA